MDGTVHEYCEEVAKSLKGEEILEGRVKTFCREYLEAQGISTAEKIKEFSRSLPPSKFAQRYEKTRQHFYRNNLLEHMARFRNLENNIPLCFQRL